MLTFRVGYFARQLSVHRNTVTNWIKRGKLPAYPAAAKQYSISKTEFIEFCKREHISREAMERVLSDFSRQIETVETSHRKKITDHSTLEKHASHDSNSVLKKNVSDEKEPAILTTAPGAERSIGSVMVVGGGVAGIQAALELADDGYYVYIIEKTAGIGGTMVQLDKIFPTNECSSCIILPKLVQCARHPNIELITLAQVEDVQGDAGDFSIKVKKSPRFIDVNKCIACGICAEKCPVTLRDEFHYGITDKKAAYLKYDHSIPLKYAIDPNSCIYFTFGKCRACEKYCPTGAVNFLQTEESIVINVGAVILAPGFKLFNPLNHDVFGYRMIKDVVTSMEFAHLLSVRGPSKGTVLCPSSHLEPRSIAWLQCIGSRNNNNCGNSYCSNICCMSAVKQSIVSEEHISSIPDRTVFYMDLRSHDKESERFFEMAKQQNVRFVRALPHTVEPGKDGTGATLRYVNDEGDVCIESFDMVVLSTGFEVAGNAIRLAERFGIELDQHNFAGTSCFNPVESSRKGIYVIGAFQSPKSIQRSVVQASAAAASASGLLYNQRKTLTKNKMFPDERDISGEKPSIGVFICSCGINIAGIVDVDEVAAYAEQLPHVAYVQNNLFSCSADVQETIMEKIDQFQLNRIVIAACTPRTHEPMFQETLKSAKLNGFMLEMANIRNQNAWVHQNDPYSATQKAKVQVRMAVAKVIHSYPLKQDRIKVVPKALVVGGGVVGMISALTIAERGIKTVLIEKSNRLGGNALKVKTCFKGEPIPPMLEELIKRVDNNKNIIVYRRTTLESVVGSVGNFQGTINTEGEVGKIDFGAAVISTGAKEAIPLEYLYGETPRVMTQLEFDSRVLYHPDEVKKASSVVFIQCTGSREPQRPYCSRICCIHSVRTAVSLKQINPDIKVYILYRDITTYGEWEEIYKEARDLGVLFIRYGIEKKPVVTIDSNHLLIEIFDPIVQQLVKIIADYLTLASGIISYDNKDLANTFKVDVDVDGFFNSAHQKLKPVDLSASGLFLAGLCNYPKPMDESIEEARAAAFRLSMLLSQDEIRSESIKAFVTKKCDGCCLCVDVCPFHAISVITEEQLHNKTARRVVIDPALCQGCGSCAATCSSQGVMVHGFTNSQLTAQIRSAIKDPLQH